jgi:hypothetical protein
MTINLDNIQRRIKAGDVEGARRMLTTLLRKDSKNAEAWALLATLLDDPLQKASCYRQIIRIDPGNQQAADMLQVLDIQLPELSPSEQPALDEEPVLRCQQCGGEMEVQFIGEMQDKRAVCSYCGTEIDLPDSYSRVRKKRSHEKRSGGSRTVEETVVETRRDGELSVENTEALPPELQEMLRFLEEKGPAGLDEEFLQKLQSSGIHVSFDPDAMDQETLQQLQERGSGIFSDPKLSHSSKTVLVRTEERDQGFLGRLLSRLGIAKQAPPLLGPSEIITLAGGALSPEESRKCPNPKCGAVISKDASECPWCSQILQDGN